MMFRRLLTLLLAMAFAESAAADAIGAADARSPADAAPYYVMGSADAPVAMVEFSDLQCPYCARYALQTLPEIKRAYIDTGKLHYAASDFPLASHAYAVPAAVAARCAGEQGRFWEYRDAVFADQRQLSSADFLDAQARQLGLDVARFRTCRADPRTQANVLESAQQGRGSGITGTPAFIIGRVVNGRFVGETVTGAKPFEEFAAKIDALLREAAPPAASEHPAGP